MGLFGSQEEGSRRGSPLIMALIIAAVGFFMYMSQTEKNPVTGISQHVSLSPDQEIRLGLQSAPEMIAEMGGEVPETDKRAQEVEYIGQLIVKKSRAHAGPWKFKFHLLKDPKTINAFALPGGQIFITVGLLDKLQNEAQLAGVLGHEIGHVIQRHSAQQMAKGQLGQILVMATGVGASDGTNLDRGRQAAMVASVINHMNQLRYSRGDENEADQWGLDLMTQAGFDPRAMLDVMKILESASPSGHTPQMLLTHPYPKEREKKIQAYLVEHPPSPNLTKGRSLKEIFAN